MSDFDVILERLLADPGFKASLAADPAAALAGYRLAPDEWELLHAQVSTDNGGEHGVEERTSKATLFGLLQSAADAAGLAQTVDTAGFGAADPGREPMPKEHRMSEVGSGRAGFGMDYHANVDADGDGRWDQYTASSRPDGGVDVFVDTDRDGRADFVGHDDDRDGLIDSADYDDDRDGRFETHMADVNGDGWMDTEILDREPEPGTAPATGTDQRRGT